MKAIMIDYPGLKLEFQVRKKFNSCEDRTEYLHQYMNKHKIEVNNHYIEDLVVECIIPYGKTETWIVGS
jgi:hypothetical protein